MFSFRSLVAGLFLSIAVGGLTVTPTYATLIVNTGPGASGIVGGSSLATSQFLAGKFTTSQDWTINRVEGWISLSDIGQTATAAIYTDGGTSPGSELFSSAFSSTNGDAAAWEGASGLNWFLTSGTYWITFEVRAGQTMFGAMPIGAPHPLAAYAFLNPGNTNPVWQTTSTVLGMRIDTTSIAAIPEPATLAIFAIGLAGLAEMRRRSRFAPGHS